MSNHFTLHFDMQSYWHIGDGRQAGVYADDIVRKHQGLPFIPGTTINGLLKGAFITAQNNHWFTQPTSLGEQPVHRCLFGEGGPDGFQSQGLLQFSNATLSASEQGWFAKNPQTRSHLYTVLTSTAIERTTGVAKEGAIRSLEVAVPMQLNAALSINDCHPQYKKQAHWLKTDFADWLDLSLSLLTGLGAKRTRGLGRVIVTASIKEEADL